MLTPHAVSVWWHRGLYLCLLAFVSTLVWLVEPRPMHWLITLDSARQALGARSFSEYKMRARRWWTWRRKYASRTKLNV